jgi:hypothetical protein
MSEKIKAALQRLHYFSYSYRLIQFWAPVQSGDKIYLTVANQPFGLSKLHKGLCSYRRLCLSSILSIPIHMNELGGEEEHNLGPIARTFRRGLHEFCNDVSFYRTEEYSLRDYAVEYGVKNYWALPLFERTGIQRIGVLEILSTGYLDHGLLSRFVDPLEVSLICPFILSIEAADSSF